MRFFQRTPVQIETPLRRRRTAPEPTQNLGVQVLPPAFELQRPFDELELRWLPIPRPGPGVAKQVGSRVTWRTACRGATRAGGWGGTGSARRRNAPGPRRWQGHRTGPEASVRVVLRAGHSAWNAGAVVPAMAARRRGAGTGGGVQLAGNMPRRLPGPPAPTSPRLYRSFKHAECPFEREKNQRVRDGSALDAGANLLGGHQNDFTRLVGVELRLPTSFAPVPRYMKKRLSWSGGFGCAKPSG